MPDTSKRHPAEHDFDHPIRGKTPGHHDHHDQKHDGRDYEDGGPAGFNLQDGFAGASSDPGAPMHYTEPGGTGINDWGHRAHTHDAAADVHGSHKHGPMRKTHEGAAHQHKQHKGEGGAGHHHPTEGGVDFTVPPVKK